MISNKQRGESFQQLVVTVQCLFTISNTSCDRCVQTTIIVPSCRTPRLRSDGNSAGTSAITAVCPTVSGQRALRPYSWMTQPSGSLAVRCVKIRYADCHAVSSLSELGNLYRVHGVSLHIFGSTSLCININIT